MTNWTAIPEEVRKELVERLLRHVSKYGTSELNDLINELSPPPPLSDAEKLEAIREVIDTTTFQGKWPIVPIRAILEGRRP